MTVLSRYGLLTLGQFLRDFAGFAGWKGVKAVLLVFFGVFVEGVGLVLLVPFFSVITAADAGTGWIQDASANLFALFGAETRVAQLGLLLGCFAGLMLARGVIIIVRDVILAQLEVGFVQSIRSRVAHRLAGAQWDVISRLRHSRITHLMSADIQELSSATHIVSSGRYPG